MLIFLSENWPLTSRENNLKGIKLSILNKLVWVLDFLSFRTSRKNSLELIEFSCLYCDTVRFRVTFLSSVPTYTRIIFSRRMMCRLWVVSVVIQTAN